MAQTLKDWLKAKFADEADAIDKLDLGGSPAPPTVPPPANANESEAVKAFRALLEQSNEQVKQLKNQVDAFTKEKADRDAQLKKAEEDKKKTDVDELLAEAVKAGKIPGDNKELLDTYRKLATADFDATKKTIDGMGVVGKPPTKPEDKGKPGSSGTPTGQTYEEVLAAANTELESSMTT